MVSPTKMIPEKKRSSSAELLNRWLASIPRLS